MTLRNFLHPRVVGIRVRERNHFTALQDIYPVVELPFTSGGQPVALRHHGGTDNGSLLSLNQDNRLIRILGKKVLSEKALLEFPPLRKLFLQEGVYPGDAARLGFILDALSGIRIVLHHLAGSATTFDVNLEKDDITGPGDANEIIGNHAKESIGVKELGEK